ncbi:hypothetical protein QOM21_00465 [Streptomyces sp. Pv4-95]|uniref:hypothetical protein n=1 Tax=Streptomyces sp. Pv4-95 TaxID=3049543 RepID=UPI00389235AE
MKTPLGTAECSHHYLRGRRGADPGQPPGAKNKCPTPRYDVRNSAVGWSDDARIRS